jgi:hypothetical protein
VSGGISHDICFRFYDPSADSARLRIMRKRLADEVFRQFDGVNRQAASTNAPNIAIILLLSHLPVDCAY